LEEPFTKSFLVLYIPYHLSYTILVYSAVGSMRASPHMTLFIAVLSS
jgi:hypothetical protein